jgi:hypothetical protein
VDFFALGVIAYECMLGKVINRLLRDPTEDITANKSDSRCFFTKPKSSHINFPLDSTPKPAALSAGFSSERLSKDWDTKESKKFLGTLGSNR